MKAIKDAANAAAACRILSRRYKDMSVAIEAVAADPEGVINSDEGPVLEELAMDIMERSAKVHRFLFEEYGIETDDLG